MASFNVCSLYSNVPFDKLLRVIRDLQNNFLSSRTPFSIDKLHSLITFYLTSCYFKFKDSFYIQVEIVAIRGSFRCTAVNIYMVHFEKSALSSAAVLGIEALVLCLRHVDGVLVLWCNEPAALDSDGASEFFEGLNSLHF